MSVRSWILTLLLSLMPLTAAADPGDLDNTFGDFGTVVTEVSTMDDLGLAMAIQSDDRIVVAGATTTATGSDVLVIRYEPDGALDLTFGVGGMVITTFGASTSAGVSSVLVDPSGRIVVAGGVDGTMLVARYTAAGVLDDTFGIGGLVGITFGGDLDTAIAVARQSDGKLVVGGSSLYFGDFDYTLLRLEEDGSFDETFAFGGGAIIDVGSEIDVFQALALQPDGKIVLAGTTLSRYDDLDFVMIRANTDGFPDDTFGDRGFVITDVASSLELPSAIAVQDDGKIVATGFALQDDIVQRAILVRYRSDGSLDAGFADYGRFVYLIQGGNRNELWALNLRPDGKIVVAGGFLLVEGDPTRGRMLIGRFDPTGTPDHSFASDSFDNVSATPGRNVAYAIGAQSDGKLVAAGIGFDTDNLDDEVVLARWEGSECGNGIEENGEECDELNTVDGDGCDTNCTDTACGNGIVTSGEDCDDGNTEDGDCCAADCTIWDSCREAGRAILQMKWPHETLGRKVTFRWAQGESTNIADFSDPVTSNGYSLCVYDADGVVFQGDIEPGGVCSSNPCWTGSETGYLFKDRKGRSDGMTNAILKPSTLGKAKAIASGKGERLQDPELPLAAPLQAFLIHRDTNLCFGATFESGDLLKNTPTKLFAQ